MIFKPFSRLWLSAAIFASVLPVFASERHFTYNYESSVLQDGGKEIETYSTYRFGRNLYYSALDQRLEFEVGLGGDVQTSFYLNFTQEMADSGNGAGPQSSFLADGISNEWKWKLMDNVADPVGLGLYAEGEFKPDELELETKIILDKKMGDWLWTLNLTAEPEYHLVDNTSAFSFIPSFGVGYFIVPSRFFLGLEVQDDNFYQGQPVQKNVSILSLGPVLSYTANGWWVTMTVLPQIADLRTNSLNITDSGLTVTQRWQVRLATSFTL